MRVESGESGGVGGKMIVDEAVGDLGKDGERYVMPIALCRPVTSRFAGMKAIVTSPGLPVGINGGIAKRMMVSDAESEKCVKVQTRFGSKYFHPLIFFAAAGSASMSVPSRSGGSCRRVASWQWSGLSWLIRMRSGSGSSERCRTQDGTT